jgi:cytochrome c-type biogenesis protein CcmH/NrfF
MTKRRLLVAGVIAIGMAVSPVATSSAQDSSRARTRADSLLDAQTRALSAELRCPVCQGLSLQDSPSELAQQMRAVVRDQLASGKTPDEVRRYFIDKYGEWILLEPQKRGFNLLVYLLPVVAIAGGAAVIVVSVRRWTSRAPRGEGAGIASD